VALAAVLVVAVAIATSGGGGAPAPAGAASGAPVAAAASTNALLAGIPQHGVLLGSPRAPVRMVEFADLQCPYCDEFSTQALPQLITSYVRPGKLSIEFRNLAFIGPDSVRAARTAAATQSQNRLWNFIELLYFNQGEENSGYVTGRYLHRLLSAIPGLDVAAVERASGQPQATEALRSANAAAIAHGVDATPSFLIGRAGEPLHLFQPASLTASAFTGPLGQLIGGRP
jgi:protein-disulfide isomerase